jgi:hypothetical protein
MLTDGCSIAEALEDVQREDPVVLTAIVSQLSVEEMKEHIKLGDQYFHNETFAFFTMDWIVPRLYGRCPAYREDGKVKTKKQQKIKFPDPQDININMLPFIMGEKDSLPEEYRHYWPIVEECCIPAEEHGKVGYLTIHESHVAKGQCQRRPGLHIETPGVLMTEDGKYEDHPMMWGCGLLRVYQKEHDTDPDKPRVEGGIYMANSVPNSCMLWDALILDPGLVAGQLGDLEHVREILGSGTNMRADTMYWLTDKTPHETLPMEEDGYRQFFRVVTSALSAWFPEHSTANRLGVKPDEKITKVIQGNKFVGTKMCAAPNST